MSKGLEALDGLRFDVSMAQYINYLEANKECDIIEKELKVLEIIKEKRVDLCILTDCDNFNEYNKSLGNLRPVEDRLTYEEFDLLKEVLCDGNMDKKSE